MYGIEREREEEKIDKNHRNMTSSNIHTSYNQVVASFADN